MEELEFRMKSLPLRRPSAGLDARVLSQMPGERQAGAGGRPWHCRRWGWGLAAAMLVLLVLYAWLSAPTEVCAPAWRNAGGEPVQRLLADGTRLSVFPEARVAWKIGDNERWVELYEGQIELDVSPDGTLFAVRTPSGRVEVVGTRFRAKAYRSDAPVGSQGNQL